MAESHVVPHSLGSASLHLGHGDLRVGDFPPDPYGPTGGLRSHSSCVKPYGDPPSRARWLSRRESPNLPVGLRISDHGGPGISEVRIRIDRNTARHGQTNQDQFANPKILHPSPLRLALPRALALEPGGSRIRGCGEMRVLLGETPYWVPSGCAVNAASGRPRRAAGTSASEASGTTNEFSRSLVSSFTSSG